MVPAKRTGQSNQSQTMADWLVERFRRSAPDRTPTFTTPHRHERAAEAHEVCDGACAGRRPPAEARVRWAEIRRRRVHSAALSRAFLASQHGSSPQAGGAHCLGTVIQVSHTRTLLA